MEITNIDGDLPISKRKLLLSRQRKKMCQFWHCFRVKRWIPEALISNLFIGWTIDIGYQGRQDCCHHENDGCAKWGAEMSSSVLYRTLRCDWRIFEGSQLPPEEILPLWVGNAFMICIAESYQSIGCKTNRNGASMNRKTIFQSVWFDYCWKAGKLTGHFLFKILIQDVSIRRSEVINRKFIC